MNIEFEQTNKNKILNKEKDVEINEINSNAFLLKKRKNSENIENLDKKENKINNSEDANLKKSNGQEQKKNVSDTEVIDLNSNTDNKKEKKNEEIKNINQRENENKENTNKNIKIQNNEKVDILNENNIKTNIINNNSEDFNFENDSLSGQLSISLKSNEKNHKNEKVKNLYAAGGLPHDKNIIFKDNMGYEFDIQVCGLRVQMGPFISDRKARSVIKFINNSKHIIHSIPFVSKREWFRNLSLMVEELIE